MSLAEENQLTLLIEKYANTMYRCAYSYCQNRTDAEDIVQDVFLKYIKKRPKFNDEVHEKAWLLRVTINTSKNYLHSFWFRKTESLYEDIEYIQNDTTNVWDFVKLLPIRYRIIIQLYYQEGYSIKEISSILKLRGSTVGTQLSRARKLLANIYREES